MSTFSYSCYSKSKDHAVFIDIYFLTTSVSLETELRNKQQSITKDDYIVWTHKTK